MSHFVEKPLFWVFGASRGIGLACTKKLLTLGYRVKGLGRTKPSLEDPCFDFEPLDLLKTKEIEPFLRKKKEELSKLEGVLLNAGLPLLGNVEEYSYQSIEKVFLVNLLAPILLVKGILPFLKKQKKAHIIAILSEAALAAKKKGSVYTASKMGLKGFLQSMQEETKNSSVNINLIYPGVVKTSFFEETFYAPEETSLEAKEIAELLPIIVSQKIGSYIPEISLFPKKGRVFFKKKERPFVDTLLQKEDL